MKYLRQLTRSERTFLKKYSRSIDNSLMTLAHIESNYSNPLFRKMIPSKNLSDYRLLVFNNNPFQLFLIYENSISDLLTFNLLTEIIERYTFINYIARYYESYIAREYRISQILHFKYNEILINDITQYITYILISLRFDN